MRKLYYSILGWLINFQIEVSDLEQMSMIHNRWNLEFRWVCREDSEIKSKNAYRHITSYAVPS